MTEAASSNRKGYGHLFGHGSGWCGAGEGMAAKVYYCLWRHEEEKHGIQQFLRETKAPSCLSMLNRMCSRFQVVVSLRTGLYVRTVAVLGVL
jgi:hypothetical protein